MFRILFCCLIFKTFFDRISLNIKFLKVQDLIETFLSKLLINNKIVNIYVWHYVLCENLAIKSHII
jgi:hypothetical protein